MIENNKVELCDACCAGGDITTCKKDVLFTIIDGCGRPLSYCSKHKQLEKYK